MAKINLTQEQWTRVAQCIAYGHQFFAWERGHKRISHNHCTYCNLTQEQAREFEPEDREAIAPGDYRYYDRRQPQ